MNCGNPKSAIRYGNPQPSRSNSVKVGRKVQRLGLEELAQYEPTSAAPERDEIVHALRKQWVPWSNTITFQSQPGTTGSGTNYQSITVSTFQYAAALLNAVVAAQSNYDERQRIAHGLGYALNRGIEVTITTLFQSFSQIVGSLGAEPDDAVLRRAWQYLADASVESDAAWLLSPGMTASLFGNDKFTSGDFVGKKVIETARLPMLYGYPAYNARLLRAPASGQAEGALLHKEAVILIRQVMPTVREQFLIRNLADGVVAFDLYNASEAIWTAETPTTDADPTPGDYGAVLIRGN